MKKAFTSALLALAAFASCALGATLTPIQLLNPAGSTSGQAIVSTGASSAPAWGGIGVNGIAAIAANTVLANATGSSASPTAFAMPSCSTGVLQYTSGTGFVCGTSVATLGLTGILTPSTTAGIKGTTAGDNANAGSQGEAPTQTATSVSVTSSAVAQNCTSVSLSAGDWDVDGSIAFLPNSGTTMQTPIASVNTTSATQQADPDRAFISATFPVNNGAAFRVPRVRVNVTGSTTAFLVGTVTFSGGTMLMSCRIWARRPR